MSNYTKQINTQIPSGSEGRYKKKNEPANDW